LLIYGSNNLLRVIIKKRFFLILNINKLIFALIIRLIKEIIEVSDIIPNSDISQENMRFYLGWGLLAIIFGLSLLIYAALGKLGLAISIFFIMLGISLFLIGISKPILPLINSLGFVLVIFGFLIYGIFVAQFNPFGIIGIAIIIIAGGMFYLHQRRGSRNE